MKKFGVICMMCSFILCFSLFPFTAAASEILDQNSNAAEIANSCWSIDADTALLGTEQRVKNVKAAFLYEANSQTLMYAWNADEPMYPASLVKIMTALIAVERGSLTDSVTVTESAISSVPYDAVSAELLAGEVLSLEDLLYCLLVSSANDAAVVIAEHISGSQSAFVEEMNRYAQELGCTGTRFINAHGLHDDAQYITARDAVRILDAAMRNETFRTVFTAVNYVVAATNKSEERELTSGNYLMDTASKLYYDARVIGGRTGVTQDGRRCLAAAAENNGMLLISVVMGAESVYQEDGYSAISIGGYKETSSLLDAGFVGYKSAQILFANQTLRQCKVTDGDSDVVIGPQLSVSTVLPENVSASDLSFRYSDEDFKAPIEAGQRLSNVTIWHGNTCVAQADLYAMNSVRSVSASQQLNTTAETDGQWGVVFWIVFGAVAGILIIVAVLRFARKIKILAAKKRSKRYRRSRRRSR